MKLSTVDTFKNIKDSSDKLVHVRGDTLNHYQEILYHITEDIISVCEKYNIVYCLLGGSALGAVRHHGFIPWDDDIDLGILGADFDRFVKSFKEEYGNKYWVHTYNTHNYGMLVSRVRLKNSVCRTREDVGNEECGFFVDIFRIENTYNNFLLRSLHGIICMGMGLLLSCRNFYKNRKLMLELSSGNKEMEKTFLTKIRIGRLLSFFTVDQWTKMTQKCYSFCKNNHSKYVTIPAGRKHYFGEILLRKDFVPSLDCKFGEHQWKIPRNYDKYLKNLYGNYMVIPSEQNHEEHVILELVFPEDYK